MMYQSMRPYYLMGIVIAGLLVITAAYVEPVLTAPH
jgi:hypothetical protein